MTDYVEFGGKIFTIMDSLFKFNNLNTYFYLKELNKIQKYYAFKTAITRIQSLSEVH